MIKIKDYIFNENDIRRIYYNKDKSCLCVGFRDEDLVTNWVENATFEDIEWNYGSQEQQYNEETEQLISSLQIKNYKLQDKIKELEEELEKEKKAWKDMLDSRDKLCNRIGKTIRLIEHNDITDYRVFESDLLSILKGEE